MSQSCWQILSLFLTFSLSTCTSESDPCVAYKELRESHRSQFYQMSGSGGNCDKDLQTDWYRFKGKAGLKMPDTCVKSGSCGTHAPGWYQGSYPTATGAVSSGNVCFNWFGLCCAWSALASVKKCNGFYVYRLGRTTLCDLQYCGDGASDPDCTTDNSDIAINGSAPGSISSPNFTHQYLDSLQCTWRITVPAGKVVRLTLKNMMLVSKDYIELRNGFRENSTLVARYADFEASVLQLYSSDRYVLVTFVSDGNRTRSAFQLEYESVDSETVENTTTTSPPSASTPKPETVENTTTTSPPSATTPKPADYAMDVSCDQDEINVILHIYSTLDYDPESVGLNDASCKPSFQNNTHIFAKSSLSGCGTTSYQSKDGRMIVYSNAIHAVVRSKKSIGPYATRDHQAVFEFHCRYNRRAVISTVSFDPSKMLIITDIESFGNFTFEMNMFKSGQFRESYSEYPIGPLDVGSQIFLQVTVTSNDSGLVSFVEGCKATPSADYNDQVQYTFMEEGCSKDNTLRYNHTLSAVQRFSLSAFNFHFNKSNEIFLHCQVKACQRWDLTSRCAKGCPFEKRKRRGSDSEYEVDQILAIGPIIVSLESKQALTRTEHLTSEEDTVFFVIMAGVLGLVMLILLTALLSVYKPRRKPNTNGAAAVLMHEDDPGHG